MTAAEAYGDPDGYGETGVDAPRAATAPERGPVLPRRGNRALEAEIKSVQRLLKAARDLKSHGRDTKAAAFVRELPQLIEQLRKRGAQRKVVVFTDDVPTQRYLERLLKATPEFRRHVLSVRGGSRENRRLKEETVRRFRTGRKKILIATNTGEEGLDLHFCSAVVSYDLPWNPQRIDRRIRRCQRYPQACDVAVLNLISRANQAEQRLHELLRDKYCLFMETFGASDGVLHDLDMEDDDSLDLTLFEAIRACQSRDEIIAELDAGSSSENGQEAARLRREFDALGSGLTEDSPGLSRTLRRMIKRRERVASAFARAAFEIVRSNAATPHRFSTRGRAFTTRWRDAGPRGRRFFPHPEDQDATELLRDIRAAEAPPPVRMRFDCSVTHGIASGRDLIGVRNLAGRRGWLEAWRVSVDSASPVGEELVVVAFDDDGRRIRRSVADAMMLLPASTQSSGTIRGRRELSRRAAWALGRSKGRMRRRAAQLGKTARLARAAALKAAREAMKQRIDACRKQTARARQAAERLPESSSQVDVAAAAERLKERLRTTVRQCADESVNALARSRAARAEAEAFAARSGIPAAHRVITVRWEVVGCGQRRSDQTGEGQNEGASAIDESPLDVEFA